MIIETSALCMSCGQSWAVPYATEGEHLEEPVHECLAARATAKPRRHLTVVR
ncbi:MAG: hypothetical protein ACT4QF_20555 [Sporichthyaceae bacterium]